MQFIDPILDESKENIERIFYLAGTRHYMGCNGQDCAKAENLIVDEELRLVLEPENKFDKNAIKVSSHKGSYIGYIPRYCCESIINCKDY